MKKTSTFLLVCISVITLLSIGTFWYVYHYIETINIQSDSLKEQLIGSQIQNVKLELLRSVATSGGTELEKLKKYIIPSGKEVDVVQQVENLASASSLAHKTELISEVEDTTLAIQNKNLLHIVISTDGSWNNSRKFLSFIEHLPYNVKIDQVDMRTVGNSNASSSLSVWHSIFTFSIVKEKVVK